MLMVVEKQENNTENKHYSQEVKIEIHPKEKENKVIREAEVNKIRGEVVGKIISSYHYVYEDCLIKHLVEDLNQNPDISAVAVLTEEHKPLGVIVRKHLFDLLGKRFGRDLIENKTIREINERKSLHLIEEEPLFFRETSILSVVVDIKEDLDNREVTRFIATKEDDTFAGIFTNMDVLFYLSSLTQADLKMAKDIQSSIIKEKDYVEEGKIKIAAASKMARGVGGDFYVFKKYNENNWLIALCDVSGKGVSASLVTTLLGGLFSIYNFNSGIAFFIQKLNEYIFNSFNMEKYLTGVFAKLDADTGKMTLYDMGHALLFVYRNKKLLPIRSAKKNFPIGIMGELELNAVSLTLQKGDIFLVLSDGIPEQENLEGNEYGYERMLTIIEENKDTQFKNIPQMIIKDVEKFRGKEPQHDDVTLLMLQYE